MQYNSKAPGIAREPRKPAAKLEESVRLVILRMENNHSHARTDGSPRSFASMRSCNPLLKIDRSKIYWAFPGSSSKRDPKGG